MRYNKYYNKKTIVDGIEFDSKLESVKIDFKRLFIQRYISCCTPQKITFKCKYESQNKRT